MLAFIQAAPAQALAQDVTGQGFEPTLLAWIVLLPLIGFLINGSAALIAARRTHRAQMSLLPTGEHPEPGVAETAAHARPADDSRDAGVDDQEDTPLPHVVEFFTAAGTRYQLESTGNHANWISMGEPIQGTGQIHRQLLSARQGVRLFYRLRKIS